MVLTDHIFCSETVCFVMWRTISIDFWIEHVPFDHFHDFFPPTVSACTCLLLSFKCRSLFLYLTPIPFQFGWYSMLRKTTGWLLLHALSWSSPSVLFKQVHHAVWLPTILWPVWGGMRLEPWRSLSGLPGDALQPHPGWSLLLPFLGMELHLLICQGSDPTLVGAWASQTLLSCWCSEAHLGLQPASCHSSGYTPHTHQVRKASVFACVCFFHHVCKRGFLVYCKMISWIGVFVKMANGGIFVSGSFCFLSHVAEFSVPNSYIKDVLKKVM